MHLLIYVSFFSFSLTWRRLFHFKVCGQVVRKPQLLYHLSGWSRLRNGRIHKNGHGSDREKRRNTKNASHYFRTYVATNHENYSNKRNLYSLRSKSVVTGTARQLEAPNGKLGVTFASIPCKIEFLIYTNP
jgi:hypothetical protein